MPSLLSRLRHFDISLLISSLLVLLTGLAVLYGIAASSGSLDLFWRQSIFALVSIVAFFIFSFYNYHTLSSSSRLVYVVLTITLLGLLVFGEPIRGSTRWISTGFFNLQPAELAKVIVLIGLARFLAIKRGQINSWTNIILTFVYALIPGLLIFLEPDLGSSLVVMGIWLGMLILSSLKKQYLAIFLIIGVVLIGISWEFVLRDYQRTRIEVFLNPNLDPQGRGYNVRQAIIAVGNGGLFGRGLGQGLQSQLKFLPERHTDFIFASSAEEIGFLGSMFLIVLYVIIFWRLVLIMKHAKDELGYFIAAGIFCLFFIQGSINIGMNVGLLPVTGIPLPFVSYGGSSLLVSGIALGIAQNVYRQSRILRF